MMLCINHEMTRDEALKTLCRRIAELRREKGLSQEALAEAMGVSRNHVTDIGWGRGTLASGACS
jgi:DNA-binding transcriptional regulator YiaG